MKSPLNNEAAAALAQFFFKGAGPSHSVLTRTFISAGFAASDPYDADTQTPNKQHRVLAVCHAAQNRAEGARELVSGLLDALRLHGSFSDETEQDNVRHLRSAFSHLGWELTEEGRLSRVGDIDLNTGGREALDEQLKRLRRNIDDPAALLGGAKELLEAVAKFVLEEGGRLPQRNAGFSAPLSMAFEMLGLQPAVVDDSIAGGKQIRAIYQSAKQIAFAVNELRNLQGTGHGRTLPTGVTHQAAQFVIREATHVAELMLSTHDRQMGR